MNRMFRSQRRRIVTEKFSTRRTLRAHIARWQRAARAERARQESIAAAGDPKP